jgi:WD40 repeat protein
MHEPNVLTVLRFHSELNEIGIDGILNHSGPVGVLCPSPSDKSMLLTVAEESQIVTLWRIPSEVIDRNDELDYNPDSDVTTSPAAEEYSMEQVSTLVDFEAEAPIIDMVWRDTSEDFGGNMRGGLALDRSGRVTQWDLEALHTVRSESVSCDSRMSPPTLAWDPHHSDAFCVSAGREIRIIDWRADTSVPSGAVSFIKAHRYGVTDLDYNPNKPFVLASSGLDGLMKFWDLRQAKTPLLTARGGHTHYAWSVKYNPFHDQLVLSSGTDSVVNLWRASTISSAPLLTVEDGGEASETSAPNVRVARHEHADSVYGITWGATDAWIYASVGYDGKVVICHVPSKEKYKILL